VDEVEFGEAGGLAYRAAGSGRPLVLLHPGPGLDCSVFFPEVLMLTERGHRVVAFDFPGNGRSPADDPAERSIAAWADKVVGCARALGFEPGGWDLLGHSFGGFVALELNNRHRGEVGRLIASCTAGSEEPPPGGEVDPLEGLTREEAAAIEDAWERESAATTPEELRQAWLDQADYYAVDAAGAARLRERWAGVTYQVGTNHGHDWGDLEALDALAGVHVLAISAEQDRQFPRPEQERIAEASENGSLVVIGGAGHFPFAETPDHYWPVVAEWLAVTRLPA
jgi:pimeloyl-ACP methyl ester carboxylesterase